MKKFKVFKKLCSLALTLAMLVAMIPTSVFATTTSSPVIDGTKTGSLTINKYDGAVGDTTKPLNGVTFNAYKIMNITATNSGVSYEILDVYQEFFKTKGINSGADLVKKDADVLNGYISELQEEIATKKIQATETATTDELNGKNGKAVMENLTLGYYLVVETGYPSHIVTPSAPFFVSIPMTSENGDEWIYDVEVHPKNQSAYGSVVINKTGNDGVALPGVIFQLEKQRWDNFNNPVVDKETGKEIWDVITTGETASEEEHKGKLTFNGLTRGVYRVKETSIGTNNGYILDDSIYREFTVEWKDGKLQYTYEGETTESLTIDVENEKPEIDKKGSSDKGATWTDDVTSHIGKDVNWKITTIVPTTIEKLTTYTIIDTLSTGLTFDKTTAGVVVTKDDTTLTEGSHYTLNVDSSNKVLTFKFNEGVLKGGEQIVIEYKTRLNENAVIADAGNPNTVKLVYSKSTTTDSTTDNWEPEDISKVYTGGVNIFKYHVEKNEQGAETEKGLAGAEFQVFASKDDALALRNPIPVLVNGNLVTTVTSGTNGIASFTGLAYGTSATDSKTYWVVETKAPEDYNLLKEPFEVTVNATSHTLTANSEGITTVLNKKGFTLPATGGIGTVIFTVAGLGMMGLAGAAYIALKRKESQK